MKIPMRLFVLLFFFDPLGSFSSTPIVSRASQIPLVLQQETQCLTNTKVAIIGAGAAGTSAAFWLAKAKARYGLEVEVDIFDKNNYVGGRSTVVWPYDDDTLEPIELGGSVFVSANKNLWRAVSEFNLTRIRYEDENAVMGIWDGQQFRFTMGGGRFYSGWLDKAKILWRYGFHAPQKTQNIVNGMIDDILALYSRTPPVFDNISSLAVKLGWHDIAAQTAIEYLSSKGVADLWSSEFVDSITRLNYGQDIDRIHGLEGLVSLAANGASTIFGGNFQIYERFLKESNATVHLNSQVTSVSRASPAGDWEIRTNGSDRTRSYGAIILAAPFHQTGITFNSDPPLAAVPSQPYVRLHVTIFTTTAPSANTSYFNLPPGAHVPDMILTTSDGAHHGGPEPEFNSLSYLRAVRKRDASPWRNARGELEWIVKIFSKKRISDAWLDSVFHGKINWVLRKEWDAYPVLTPTTEFPPVKLVDGLYYVNAFEPLISTIETETVSARNAVDLMLRDKFNAALCKSRSTSSAEEDEALRVTADDFVYGWDC